MGDVRKATMVGRTTDGRLVERPLSPHLQVYRPQMTSMLSILHRICGVALSVGALLLVCWLVAAASGEAAYDGLSGFLRSWFGVLLLFGWSAALWYHLCNGLRHLAWDAGYGYEMPTLYRSGAVVVAAAAALTVLTWIIAIVVW
jgi:succinate dehydrogenase / fumarate reductase cytochrome b subunit